MPPKAKAKESVADILATMNKKYSDKFSVGFESNAEFLDTGNMALNHLIGGGVPLGRITQFYGQSMSGKTTAALQTAATTQKKIRDEELGKVILYLDYECALDEDYAEALGLDINDSTTFLMLRPDDFETGANMARELIKSDNVLLAIWDSVPSMIPSSVFEDDVGKAAVAPLPRVLAPFLGTLNPIINKSKTACIFINHIGEKIGGMPGFGPPAKVRPGGKALTYYSSVMIEFTGTTKEKGKVYNVYGEEVEVPIATETKMVCTKNKVGVPMREARALVRYGEGFDNLWSARKILENKKLIVSSGAWIKLDPSLGGESFNGSAQFYSRAATDSAWRWRLISEAEHILKEDPSPAKVIAQKKLFAKDEVDEQE
jgi:recombination protein RecA